MYGKPSKYFEDLVGVLRNQEERERLLRSSSELNVSTSQERKGRGQGRSRSKQRYNSRDSNASTSSNQSQGRRELFCNYCLLKGHHIRQCRTLAWKIKNGQARPFGQGKSNSNSNQSRADTRRSRRKFCYVL